MKDDEDEDVALPKAAFHQTLLNAFIPLMPNWTSCNASPQNPWFQHES